MQYPRAGLVTLLFALIISLVSAVPIRVLSTESSSSPTLFAHASIPNLNVPDRTIQLGAIRKPENLLRGRMSTLPLATKLTRRVRLLPFPLLLASI